MKIPIILIICLYLLNVPSLWVVFDSSIQQKSFRVQVPKSMFKPLQLLSENLKTDPIVDIQTLERGSICPSGFEILKLGIWPGTVEGCLCEDGSLYTGPCRQVRHQRCNKELSSSSPINLYEWNGSIWCAKRAVLGTDYLRKAECPIGYQECYPGGCFLKECPVTKVESSLEKGLLLRKTQGELPLINIQLISSDISCPDKESKGYVLLDFPETECDKYGFKSQLSTGLASQTAYDSYIQNSFSHRVMNLPYFVGNATVASSVLSSMTRIKTAKHDSCMSIDGRKSINNFIEAALFPIDFRLICPMLIFVCQLQSVLYIQLARSPKAKTRLFKNSSQLIKLLCFFHLMAFIIMIVLLAYASNVSQSLQVTREYFERYSSLGCFTGSPGETVINDYLENLESVQMNPWIYVGLLTFQILSGLLLLRVYIVKKNSKREIELINISS